MSRNRAVPVTTRTPSRCTRARMSADCASASPRTRPCTLGRSTLGGSTEMPSSGKLCRLARAPDEAMNVFEGTQS